MVFIEHNSLKPLFLTLFLIPYLFHVLQDSCFSGARFFRVQVFQGPGFLGSRFFQSPGFSESRFFSVQVFLGPDFSGSRFSRVHVFLDPGFSGSRSRARAQVLKVAVQKSIAELWTIISDQMIKYQLLDTQFYQISNHKRDIY